MIASILMFITSILFLVDSVILFYFESYLISVILMILSFLGFWLCTKFNDSDDRKIKRGL
jgi:positive regulator of sigma E activity